MLYNVGDVVRVRDDLKDGEVYLMENGDDNCVTSEMVALAGCEVEITGLYFGQYLINGDSRYRWTDDMFSGLAYDMTEINLEDVQKALLELL